RLRHAVRGGGRGRDLCEPHPRGPDGGERPRPVVCVRQSAQGRGAQRHPDRRMPDQPQAHRGQAQGGVTGVPRSTTRYEKGGPMPAPPVFFFFFLFFSVFFDGWPPFPLPARARRSFSAPFPPCPRRPPP